jgi:protein-disulfide isomerase
VSLHRRLALALSVLVVLTACASAPPPPPTTIEVQAGAGATPSAPPPPAPSSAPVAAEEASEDDASVPVSPADPTWGSRTASVTLVLFEDFQCPFCGRLAPTIRAVEDKYGPHDLRVVWKNNPLPFHPNARPAAEAAEALFMLRGSDAFWKFHDAAFANQAQLAPAQYEAWASAAGVDPGNFKRLVDAHAGAAKIDLDVELAKKVGALGTPTSFINGVLLSGAQPLDRFTALIDAEMAKAQARVAGGTAPDAVYVAMSRENFKAAPPPDRGSSNTAEDTAVWKVPVGNAPVRGSAAALVTIVEFGDFQCPYCKRVEETLTKVLSTYGNKVRLAWRDEALPFHPRALPAANLAREARAEKGQAAFWAVHDALFASQKLEDADLEAIARSAGLDVSRSMSAVTQSKYKAAIELDGEVADDFQASGTPHFFINGRRLVGAQPFEKFQAIIDEEIRHGQGLLAKGVALPALYDALIKDGRTPSPPEARYVAPAATGTPFKGGANAQVVIQEFADFQCPFCRRAEDTLRDVEHAYGANVKIVWRDLPLPFHTNAALAAEAAREAFHQKGNSGFWQMHDKLFAAPATGGLERQALDGYAREIGLDMAAWTAALDNHTHKAHIDLDAKAASDANISGTPAFVISGYFLSGAQPLAKFRKIIARVLQDGPARPSPPSTPHAPSQPSPSSLSAAVPSPPSPAGSAALAITDIVVGAGPVAKSGDRLTVHYVGTLTDGTEFDSSRTRGKPFQFNLGAGQVIKGWDQGLVGMRVGGRRKLTIGPSLAYGDRGAGGTIPPGSTLVFDVELLSIP